MREDADFSARMLSDLQLWGVDKLDGASVTIAGQVVCTDSGRWSVQREFNRRMKRRFEELGIQLYNPVERMVAVRQITERGDSHEAQLARRGSRPTGSPSCTAAEMRGAVRPDGGLAGVRGELGRSRPRHLHGRWRALPEAPPRRVRRARRRADPPQAAPAALPEPRLQPAERRHRALVRSGAAGDRRRREHDGDPGDLPRAVRAPGADARLAHRGAPVPHRGAQRRGRASRPRRACTATASITCWCCWSAAATSRAASPRSTARTGGTSAASP